MVRQQEQTVAIRIVRLGSERAQHEGLRIGTVRRPPRGVPKTHFASGNWYDVWFPVLAPSVETMKTGRAATTGNDWAAFVKRYKTEMTSPDAIHSLNLLAAMSHGANFSVGCYCELEARCHRSVLRELLVARGAYVLSVGT
jgi:uncharacterized protein YeaO (DUF488 family)